LTPTRKTTQRRGGSHALARLTAVLAVLFWLAPAPGAQPRFTQAQPGQASYAVVAGTVFQEDGRLLRGAQVSVKPDPGGGTPPRGKPLTTSTDQRGEFAVRVPAVPMRYTLVVKAPGFRVQEKAVSVTGDERVDVFFQMERDAPGK
jgi:hypothetical protein